MSAQVQGVHFVGSIPFENTEAVFEKCGHPLGNRIRRIPDGETGDRGQWTIFQRQTFGDRPELINRPDANHYDLKADECSEDEGEKLLASLPPANTRFDTHALASYEIFKKARAAGQRPADAKFMVTFPTPLAVLSINFAVRAWLKHPTQLNIQAKIPKEDLAIQFDIAVEFAVLEKFSETWFGQDEDVLFQRVVTLADRVEPGVDLGFHLCYGDFGHKHFKEPEDAHFLNLAAVELIKRVGRPIEFIHLPVPVARDDAKFFAPLKELQSVRGNTEIYLGLVHPRDLEGTQRRIKTASEVLHPFGVATECGMGRTPLNDVTSILEISKEVAAPF